MKNLMTVILMLSQTVLASSLDTYDKDLVRSVDRILGTVDGKISNFCEDNDFDPALRYKNCSPQEAEKVETRQVAAMKMIKSWLTKARDYEMNSKIKKMTSLESFGETEKRVEVSELTVVASKLQCILNKMNQVKFVCNSKEGTCADGADAYTLPIINTPIHLCATTTFEDKNRTWGFWSHDSQEIGLIIHEMSHKCSTTDAAYFNKKNTPPKSTKFIHWSNIADTYEYWARYGFCVPDIDCDV